MATLQIIEAVVDRLKRQIQTLAVENFPDKPSEYRLNHPNGALLVSYAGSHFGEIEGVGTVVQRQTITLSITVVMRLPNGSEGAVDVLDKVRAALIGFKPPDCHRKMWALNERFLDESAGIWQYALDMNTESILIEVVEDEPGALLTNLTMQDEYGRNEIRKMSDGTIIKEEFSL
ncbi:Gp37 family protein [Undibacterium sp. 14-3-2]|jgi:hypothetical protein|uniref:Gp37 family protein n=1 Tax=Undibacterium sp. 14-3-2 TaxID=2800129 RepID=UPI00190485BA|nr:Gp37 family protein [Undibacterium sp. 14-3-2]MBK1890723.1 Gp37 family protein [Undibacterium sp. 14-3-2]